MLEVGASVGALVGALVGGFVRALVGALVGTLVGALVDDISISGGRIDALVVVGIMRPLWKVVVFTAK